MALVLDLATEAVRENAAVAAWLRQNSVPLHARRVEFDDGVLRASYVLEDENGHPLRDEGGAEQHHTAELVVQASPAEALAMFRDALNAARRVAADAEAAIEILEAAGAAGVR